MPAAMAQAATGARPGCVPIRREALQQRVTYSTTIAGARALVHSLEYRGTGPVWSLQELHRELQS